MRKLFALICKVITFACFIMVALFVYDLFFWSKTEEGRLASKVIIIFFSLAGFFMYCIHCMVRKGGHADDQDPWDSAETQNDYEKEYIALGYALPLARVEPSREHGPKLTRKYKLKVMGLAIAGYAYILGIICVLGILLYHLVRFAFTTSYPYIILIMSLPVLLFVTVSLKAVLAAVRTGTTPPKGIEVDRGDAPELFETMGHLQERLQGPGVGKIVLTNDFAASIVRIPRLGILGWHRNYLVLGLPLLQALSVRQMLALLAHEYSHLSGEQGRFDSWIYSLRETWLQTMRSLESRKHWSREIVARFFRWYAPYFHSYTSSFAKSQEYAADQCSVAFAGGSETAAALVRTGVMKLYLQESFWPMIMYMMETTPEPVESLHGLMQERFLQGIDGDRAKEWVERSLRKEPGSSDAHPDLKKRLDAINEAPVFRNSLEMSSAQYYFPNLDAFRKKIDDEWRSYIRIPWQERYAYVHKLRTRIEELSSKARLKPLNVEEALDLAFLTEDLSGSEKALPLFERILKYKPECVPALCAAGRILLAKLDESGAACIERVIDLDPNYCVYGLEVLYNFYLEKGDREKTGKYYQKLSDQKEQIEQAEQAKKLEMERSKSAEKGKRNARKRLRTGRAGMGLIKVCPVENNPIFP